MHRRLGRSRYISYQRFRQRFVIWDTSREYWRNLNLGKILRVRVSMRTSHDLGSCTSRCRRLTTYLTTLPLSTNLRCDCPPTPGSGLGFRNQSPSKMLTNLPKIGHQLTRCVRVGCLLTFRTWRNKEQYRWISIRCNNRLRRCNSNLTP